MNVSPKFSLRKICKLQTHILPLQLVTSQGDTFRGLDFCFLKLKACSALVCTTFSRGISALNSSPSMFWSGSKQKRGFPPPKNGSQKMVESGGCVDAEPFCLSCFV